MRFVFFFRWDNKASPKIVVEQPAEDRERTPSPSNLPVSRLHQEPPSPAPREIVQLPKIIKEEKSRKEDKPSVKERNVREDKIWMRSPKEDKISKKDKKKMKEMVDDITFSSERIIIGGEDATKNSSSTKSRLPHEVLAQFEGKTREVIKFHYNIYVCCN